MLRRAAIVLFPALLCVACFGQAHTAQARAEYDLACSKESIHAFRVVGGTYVAEGCGRRIEYACLVDRGGVVCFPTAPVTRR